MSHQPVERDRPNIFGADVARKQFSQWAMIIVVVATSFLSASLSAAFTYGVISTKLANVEERTRENEAKIEHLSQTYLTREEYQRYHQILEDKMEKRDEQLNQKLDDLIIMHGGRPQIFGKKKLDGGNGGR